MYYVKVEPGVRIAVYDLNQQGKNAVFFIHGWPINHNMFEYQFNILAQNGYRCISMDLRGFGNSDAPWTGYTYDRMADDVYEVIKTLNVPKLTLVGFSMGGSIAIRYMARHRGYKVSKLALWSAAAPSFTRRPDNPYGMTVDQVNMLISQIYNDRPQAVTDFGKIFFASQVTPSFREWFNSMAFGASGHGTIHTAVSLRDSDLRDDLGKIRVPTGIFHGALDQICPFEFALEMNQGIRNSQIYKFDKSGHGAFYDQMEKFTQEFSGFLRQ